MSGTETDEDLAASQFDDAKRSVDSVERSGGEAVDVAPDTSDDAEGADDALRIRANDELTDGDAVR
jgi:hypothetical protein